MYRTSIALRQSPYDPEETGEFNTFREAYEFSMISLQNILGRDLPPIGLDDDIALTDNQGMTSINLWMTNAGRDNYTSVNINAAEIDDRHYIATITDTTTKEGRLNILFFDWNMYQLERFYRPLELSPYLQEIYTIMSRTATRRIPYNMPFEDFMLYCPIELSLSAIAGMIMRQGESDIQILASNNGSYKLVVNGNELVLGREKYIEVHDAADWTFRPQIENLDTIIDRLLDPYDSPTESRISSRLRRAPM